MGSLWSADGSLHGSEWGGAGPAIGEQGPSTPWYPMP